MESPQDVDDPVEFVRVLVNGAEVIHAVNGWPASFRIRVNRGQVLFTTMGPRGWVRPRTARDPQPVTDTAGRSVALSVLTWLGRETLGEPPVATLDPIAVRVLSEEVGYQVPRRSLVLGVLGGFCLVVGGTGAWLARRRKLERLGWIGPGAAIIAAAIFVACGMSGRQAVPPTAAMFQQAEVDPAGEEIDVRGLMALYQPEPSASLPAASRGGLFLPDRTGLEGAIHRMVWTDADAWHWEQLMLPAGVRIAPIRQTVRCDAPAIARGEFGPDGFGGTLSGPFRERSDSVLVCPSGRNLVVRWEENGRFTSGPGDELAHNQFLNATLLTAQQQRRQAIYEQILPADGRLPRSPRLYLWAECLNLGFTLPEQTRQTGSALVGMPVRIAPTPSGTRVLVPAPFLLFQSVQLNDIPLSSAYDNRSRQWVQLGRPNETWLRFQLPAEVLPLKVDRAVLTMAIDAPSRAVDVLALSGKVVSKKNSIALSSRQGPRGKWRLVIDRPEALIPDSAGGIHVGIRVGDDARRSVTQMPDTDVGTPWAIESVALEVGGEVERPNPDRRPE